MTGLHIHSVSHAFNAHRVLNDVSLTVAPGELVCLLGPSGCGKSTLLRIVAGLERLRKGHVIIDDQVVADANSHMPTELRSVGLMFQDYALFPHLTILENVTFGLLRRPPKAARERAMEMLEQVGMADHATKHPHVLSGGQQQRVALARALAPEPRLMLLDEPFSGLDASMRVQIREENLSVLKQSGIATLMVTHDPEEAMFMADRICIIGADGRARQCGSPADVYYCPADNFVARLFGPVNRFDGVVRSGEVVLPFGPIPADGIEDGKAVEVLIRPEGLIFDTGDEGASVEVISTCLMGQTGHVRFKLPGANGTEYRARVYGNFLPVNGERLRAWVDEGYAFVYPKE